MGIRAKTGLYRCNYCRLHAPLCLCQNLQPVDIPINLILVMHQNEGFKTSNTGCFLQRFFSNCQVLTYGARPEHQLDHDRLVFDPQHTAILFPASDATPLNPSMDIEHLIIPDGTWRQASKLTRRIRHRHGYRVVTVPPGPASRYRLRQAPREGWICTFEAVSRAIGALGHLTCQAELDAGFAKMADRLAWVKGRLHRDQVTGGIPEGLTTCDLVPGLP